MCISLSFMWYTYMPQRLAWLRFWLCKTWSLSSIIPHLWTSICLRISLWVKAVVFYLDRNDYIGQNPISNKWIGFLNIKIETYTATASFAFPRSWKKKNQRLLMSKMSAVKTFLISLSKTDPAKASVAKFVCLFYFLVDNGKFERWSGG